MVSRRRILSRSRDDLQMDMGGPYQQEEEEDVWFQKDKLYKDHIQEVLEKWQSIDDEIWSKIIVLERNRRVAKAYARAPVLTVNGTDNGFDGFRIGLCGFDNPMRDPRTDEVKRHIGSGVKVKMDDQGNILVKRVAKCQVYVKNTVEESSVSNEILKLPQAALEYDKPVKLFDMRKFQQNVSRELKRAYPDRRKLECQCISALAFVKNESDLLQCPIWVMIINIVAMDMLKSKLPPVKRAEYRTRPKLNIADLEDPYSVAGSGSGSSNSSGRPPKLPPRDNDMTARNFNIPKPDYDELDGRFTRPMANTRGKGKPDRKLDDPYYCGLRARVPNFKNGKKEEGPWRKQAASPYYQVKSYDTGLAGLGQNGYGKIGATNGYMKKNYSTMGLQNMEDSEETEWENYWDQ